MTNYLLLLLSLAAGLTYNVVRNLSMKKHIRTQAENYLFNTVSALFTAAVLFIMTAVQGEMRLPSLYTLLLGLLFGAVTALTAILNMRAFGMGPMSYTTVIISCSMIIPSLFGLFRGDTLSWAHYVGMAMMLVCMVLSVTRDKDQKKANVAWFLCCLVTFALNGSIGIMQQIHQGSSHKEELNLFLLVAFLFSAVYSFAGFLYYHKCKKEEVAVTVRPGKFLFWMCGITGVCVAAANIINLYLSGVMNSAVFFPVINGGGLILSALAGIVLFGEKFSAKKWIGLGVGTAAILLLCLEKIF